MECRGHRSLSLVRPPEVLDGGVSGLGDDDRPGVVVLPDDGAVRLGEGLDHLEVVLREELVVQHALVEGEPDGGEGYNINISDFVIVSSSYLVLQLLHECKGSLLVLFKVVRGLFFTVSLSSKQSSAGLCHITLHLFEFNVSNSMF